MEVVGQWGRGLGRAGAVALLIPVALVVGIALTAALGGGDRLHALGQVVSGPSQPAATRPADTDLAKATRVPPLRLAAALRAAGTHNATTAPRRRTARAHRPVAPSSPTRPGRPNTTTQPTASPAPSPGSGPSPPPPSAPPPSSPVRNTGEQVVGVAQQLPAPVGPVAGDAVQTVVDLVAPPPGA